VKRTIHAITGCIALCTISIFWISTVFIEIFGTQASIATVKTGIVYGMALLIPALAIAGTSGTALGKSKTLPWVSTKTWRMKLVAVNGLLILLPGAIFLAGRAQAGQFDTLFYLIQAAELIAGTLNITLLLRNLLDGLSRRRDRKERRMH